jgi:hypothetical protein
LLKVKLFFDDREQCDGLDAVIVLRQPAIAIIKVEALFVGRASLIQM